MASAAAALLDQLMGKHRNMSSDERPVQKWSDDDVCKHHFIAGFCPHELFANTKSDIGKCPKQCGDSVSRLKEGWDKATAKERRPHEIKFARLLRSLLVSCDAAIAAAKKKHNADKYNDVNLAQLRMPKDARIERIDFQINQLTEEIEKHGEEGKMDEISRCKEEIESLEREKHNLQTDDKLQAEFQKIVDKGKTTIVCEICGAVTTSLDNEERIQFHLQGKQHLGWKKVRDTLSDLEKKFIDNPISISDEPSTRRRSRSRSRRRDRDRRDRRSRSRGRSDRDRGRDHRRHRDRDRDRDRRRRRSRSSDRRDYRRDRDRDYRRR